MRRFILLGTVFLLLLAIGLTHPARAVESVSSDTQAAIPAAIVGLSGEIDDYNRDSFFKRFRAAKAIGAKTIIVEIDTWGGLVTSGLDISRFLKSQNDVHTIAYVNDRAISAGAMIAMACDEIVMKDVATLGDCAPIARNEDGSLHPLPAAERAKFESPIDRDFYESAIRNHHDPLLARAMVVTEVAVYWIVSKDSTEKRFVDQKEYDQLIAKGWSPVAGVPNPVDSSTQLLTVGTDLAVRLGLATGHAATPEQLATARHLNILESFRSGFGEAAIASLNAGWVRMLLMIVCGVAIYSALHAPGHGMAEALVVTTLGLLLGVPLLTGYASWWELLLILGGLAMIAFEIFVFPHAGIMIIAGVLMMVGGMILTFVGNEPGGFRLFPTLAGSVASLKHGVGFVTGALFGIAVLSTWIGRYLPRLPIFGKIALPEPAGPTISPATATIEWPTVGALGRAVTVLRPGGTAEFPNSSGSEFNVFPAVSENGFLPAGSPVIVRDVGGGRVLVRSTLA
jgi:membrane-bound serine protease (ClpP class)